MVVAAEGQALQRVGVAARQLRLEADAVVEQHAGRGRHDHRARRDGAARGADLDIGAAGEVDRLDRVRELHRQPLREIGDQRAKALPAELIDVALGGLCEIGSRDVREVLGAAERAEHELDRRLPVGEVLRQGCLAGNVGAAAAGLEDGAVRAHHGGEVVLHLDFAGVAAADAELLGRRRRIDVEPGARDERRDRIEFGRVDPVGTAVIGHAERRRVGEAAAADAVGRLEHDEPRLGGGDAARSGDAGGAGADDDDFRIRTGRAPGRSGRTGGGGGGRCNEPSAAELRHDR